MKKLSIIAIIALAACAVIAQQLRPVEVQSTTIPPATWTGTNAQILTSQLLAMTNANGSLIVPTNFLTGQTVIVFRIISGTNGVKAITASVR